MCVLLITKTFKLAGSARSMLQVRSSLALLCQGEQGEVLSLGFRQLNHMWRAAGPLQHLLGFVEVFEISLIFVFFILERILKIRSAQLPVLRTLQTNRLRATSHSQNFKKQGLFFLTALPCFYFILFFFLSSCYTASLSIPL